MKLITNEIISKIVDLGFIPWDGNGAAPVGDDINVYALLRCNFPANPLIMPGVAGSFRWSWKDKDGDIIGYRLNCPVNGV